MMTFRIKSRETTRSAASVVPLLLMATLIFAAVSLAQPYRYRTFGQDDLAEKKAKAGKATSSVVCFTFKNELGDSMNGLYAKLNTEILSIEDSGGYPTIQLLRKGKELQASGKSVASGDSVTLCFTVSKKAPGSQVSNWYWMSDGEQASQKYTELPPTDDVRIRIQPNGGNVLEHVYKRVLSRPTGLVLGLPTDTPAVGWIRYMKADRKYFVHTGTARCFDGIMAGSGRVKAVKGELKNPHVKKHDNQLLGELHALKLAIVANDSGVTEPLDTNATLFGDLIYRDSVNMSDPFNDMTIRQIVYRADSAFTYCSYFAGDEYTALLTVVSRINVAFDGEYVALSFDPFILAGTRSLDDVYFLHPNPAGAAARTSSKFALDVDEMPAAVELAQNYPNPFNPQTTIGFELTEPSLVTLKVYNLLGQEVATLLDREYLDEGTHEVVYDASTLTSGVYFYRVVTSSGLTQTHRMVLVK